ncbi:hypothetical protein ACWDCC_43505, partial [Streptomyces sp. NPDC001102]
GARPQRRASITVHIPPDGTARPRTDTPRHGPDPQPTPRTHAGCACPPVVRLPPRKAPAERHP